MSAPTEFDVFLSYDKADRAAAASIARALEDRGRKVLLDLRLAEALFKLETLEQQLLRCRTAIVAVGASTMEFRQKRLVDLALQRQARNSAFRLIPVLLPGAEPPSGYLSLFKTLDLRGGVEDSQSLDVLAAAVGSEPSASETDGSATLAAVHSSHARSAPVREDDARRFFRPPAFVQGLLSAAYFQRLRRRLHGLRAWLLPDRVADPDRLPTPLLIALGLVPAAALAWLASHSPLATAVLVLLVPVAAVWQGRRVRVVWEHGIPAEVEEAPPERPRPVVPDTVPEPQEPLAEPEPPAPEPPYPLQDPLIELMALPGGTFWMGSDKALDPQAYDDELPRREVSVRPFAIAVTPITRDLYRTVMKLAPQQWERDGDDAQLPANDLSWEDAVRFCNGLSEQSGLDPCYRQTDTGWVCDWDADGYRLPTEAEWERACRAGTQDPWFWGADEKDAGRHAWFSGNSDYRVHPVAEKEPNRWGLYDMAGNLWEWCWDWYADYDPSELDNPRGPTSGERRVLRGGPFYDGPRNLRSAVRFRDVPVIRDVNVGFRCVRGSVRQLDH